MRRVSAVSRAAAILDLVGRAPQPPSIASIGAMLGIPRNTTYQLVYTLADAQLLRVVDGRLHLGVRTFELGSRYAMNLDLVTEAREVAGPLRDVSGETVHVAVLDGRDAVYLVKEESRQAVRMSSRIGLRLPAHVSAVGKAMLAALPATELDALLDGVVLERMTSHSITDLDALRKDLHATRERGYAIDNQESSPDVACVAAAVRDGSGSVVAGVSISMPLSRMPTERREEFASMAIQAANAFSTRLGFVPYAEAVR